MKLYQSALAFLSISHQAASAINNDPLFNNTSNGECDYLKWRTCSSSTDCEWDQWKNRPYDTSNSNNIPALWESADTYSLYSEYTCASPAIEHSMTGCDTMRCIPTLTSGYSCQLDSDCYDGQVCNIDTKLCTSCGGDDNAAAREASLYYSNGACHQPPTDGAGDTPIMIEGQSGCAGDHCHHECAYDTQCVRITENTIDINVIATHNQLPKVLTLDDESVRNELTRPSSCDGNDAGGVDSGMRCARTIHRAITSLERTPEEIRDRNLDVVELSVMKNGGDRNYENYILVDESDITNRAMEITQEGGRGYSIGYLIDEVGDVRSEIGDTVSSSGVYYWNVHPWERRGLIQCDVRYTDSAPLHMTEDGETRSTLLTRVCIRYEDPSASDPKHSFTNGTDQVFFNQDSATICGVWGTTSTLGWLLNVKAKCTLSGPNVSGVVPTEAQRDTIENGLRTAFEAGQGHMTSHEFLRASFHDAAAYTPNPASIFGGARGCMRYEHVHGNAPNIGLAFLFEHPLWNAIGCQPGKDFDSGSPENGAQSCWSMADILVFAGAVASDVSGGPGMGQLASSVKWGRVDAPRIFCPGELQLTMPDATASHKLGANIHGSSDVNARLQTVHDATKTYFEDQLGLLHEDWVAYLAGGHSIGGVKGLIQAKNTRFNFDSTPGILDSLYLHRVERAKQTGLMSLCPQAQKPGSSHFWEPTGQQVHEGTSANDHDVLIDNDVSLTMDDETMNVVRMLGHNQDLFFEHYANAFLQVSELGYTEGALHLVGTQDPTTTTEAPPSTTTSSTSVSTVASTTSK